MNLTDAKTLLDALEESRESVQLHHSELERLIVSCMDAIYELSVLPSNSPSTTCSAGQLAAPGLEPGTSGL